MANFVIDKSRFNDEQLAQYEALVAIGKAEVDPAANHDGDGTPAPQHHEMEENPMAKSAPEMSPELKTALDELADLKKSLEMKDMTEVAKKYATGLGKNESELAKTLYNMKKSNPANYDAYIAVLDESLDLVEKSGTFAEIGKSGHGGSYSGLSGAEAKVDAKAKEIMKADPNIGYTEAVAKAWIENPDLAAEYEAEYSGN